jgi:hypothetical protein
MVESPPFFYVTSRIFNETSPKLLFIKPGYNCVLSMILLVLAGAGGSVGILFSEWSKRKSFLFLLAILLVIAIFDTLGSNFNLFDR